MQHMYRFVFCCCCCLAFYTHFIKYEIFHLVLHVKWVWFFGRSMEWMKKRYNNSTGIGKRFSLFAETTHTLTHAKNFTSFQVINEHIYRKCYVSCSVRFIYFTQKKIWFYSYFIKAIFYVMSSSWLILMKHRNTITLMMIVFILNSYCIHKSELRKYFPFNNNGSVCVCLGVSFLLCLSKKLAQPEVIVQFNNAF